MHSDEQYMSRAIQLAQLGLGRVAPNPLVGCVIVHNDKIIGEGYHEEYGSSHAEVNAINSVKNKTLLSESTIYVTLEPCAHYGHTPPCADLIAEHNFKRVVIGACDPHSKVDGKGIQIIQDAKIDTTIGVMEADCHEQNRFFFTSHVKQRPYVMLKWAQTKNGWMDNQGKQEWITAPATKSIVHQWRNEYHSIMVGRKTIENDDPSLTVREVSGINPIRIIIDPENCLSKNAKVFDGKVPTIVLNTILEGQQSEKIDYYKLKELTPEAILAKIHDLGIVSVMIEGGANTINRFITADLWDEMNVITGKIEFEKGTVAPKPAGKLVHEFEHFGDQFRTYRNL